MTAWVAIALEVICGIAFFQAARRAASWDDEAGRSLLLPFGAAVAFLAAILALVEWSPEAGFSHFVAVAAPAVLGLSTLWWTKVHVDAGRSRPAFVAAMLAFALFAMSLFVALGTAGRAYREGPRALSPQERLSGEIARLADHRKALEDRLMVDIPAFSRKLHGDVDVVRGEIARATVATKTSLESELREIARLLLALEKEEAATRDLVTRVKQEGRRLERLRDTQTVLQDDDPLWQQLEHVERETGVRLTRPIDDRIGAGAVEDVAVQKKVQDLLRGS